MSDTLSGPSLGGTQPPTHPASSSVQTYTTGATPNATDSGAFTLASEFQPLNADRFVLVGFPQRQAGADGTGHIRFPVLDLTKGSVITPEVATPPDIGGVPELVHYDADKGSGGLFVGRGDGATQYRFAHWNLATDSIDWTQNLGPIDDHTDVQPIGVDPSGSYFYFLKETNATKPLTQYDHADKATVGRVNLTTHEIDWIHDLDLPGRSGTLMGSLRVMPSTNYSRIAVLEYSEPADANAAIPAHGFVVEPGSDHHTTIDAPMTPYGIAFDRQNRYLAIASNSAAKIYRYDLQTAKQDMAVGTIGRVHALALDGANSHLYVFAKGRTVQMHDWPSLKASAPMAVGTVIPGQTWVDSEGMAVTPDGNHAVLARTEAPYGFRDDVGFYAVDISHPPETKPAPKAKPH